jgi:hypothetical protein
MERRYGASSFDAGTTGNSVLGVRTGSGSFRRMLDARGYRRNGAATVSTGGRSSLGSTTSLWVAGPGITTPRTTAATQ